MTPEIPGKRAEASVSETVSEPSRPMIIHVTTVPLTLGFLRGQAAFFRERGLALRAVSSPGELLDRYGEIEGVPTHAVPMARRITPFSDLIAVIRLWRLFRRLRPVIVHSHTPKGGVVAMVAAFLARVPVRVFHMRGLPLVTANGIRRRLLVVAERVSCRLAHRVICVSSSLLEVALQERLVAPEKARVLAAGSSNGVDARDRFDPARVGARDRAEVRRRFAIGPEDRVIGFVGRIVRDKGVVDLAGAWSRLRRRYPDVHLLLVGPEEPRDPAPPKVMDGFRGDPRVHVAGLVHDAPAFYAAMDLVAFPSYREGFPNVPLEAAAMALPVVATRVTGTIDAVLDGVTGALVEMGDPESLAAAIARYLDEPELARRHGLAARERALTDFPPERIWHALYAVYRELLEARDLPLPAFPPGIVAGDGSAPGAPGGSL